MKTEVRFASVRLRPFGIFEDAAFAFERTPGAPDLHVIVGDNEAGKTTLKHALVHFLFAIPPRSPYLFRYPRPVVEAQVEVDGRMLSLARSTGRSASLRPSDAAGALGEALRRAGVSGETFAQQQAFSHAQMREHARALHDSGGDLKDLLMRDAGGLSTAQVLKELEGEARELFVRDGRNTRNRFRQVEAIWKEAGERFRQAELSAGVYQELRRDKEAAAAELARARRERAQVAEAERQLDGLVRAEGLAGRLGELEDALASLPELGMAADAVERVHRVRRLEDIEVQRRDLARERAAAAERALAALARDPAVVLAADAIDALGVTAAELRGALGEAERARASAEAARGRALALARAAGWPADDLCALERTLPPQIDRREARRHAAQRPALESAVVAAREALRRIDEAAAPQLPQEPPAELGAALDAHRALGRYAQDWRSAGDAVAEAQAACERAQAATCGEADSDAPPPPEEGEAAQAAIAAARRAFERADDALKEDAARLAELRRRVEIGLASDVPTVERLGSVRAARDALWAQVRAGRPAGEVAPDYERAVTLADHLADERFHRVEAIVAAEQARADLALAEARRDERERICAARRAALEALEAGWAERLRAAGLPHPPADYGAWFERRRRRREAAAALARAVAAREELRGQLVAVLDACRAALARPPEPVADHHLVDALGEAHAAARERYDGLQAALARARAARDAYEADRRARPALARDLQQAEARLAQWRETWRGLAARCAIEEEISAERLTDLFDRLAAVDEELARARADADRAYKTERAEAAFAGRVARLAEELGEEAETAADADATVRRLLDRLERARVVERERERLTVERDEALRLADAAEADRRSARAQLAADLDAAGLAPDAPLAALLEAARRSDERRLLTQRRDEALAHLADAGHRWPQVREALAQHNAAERRARHAELVEEGARLDERIEQAQQHLVRAEVNLSSRLEASLAGGGAAATARLEERSAEAEIGALAAEAIRRRLELVVLSAARDAFVAQNRSPILERASRLFATFTCGAYDRLERGEGDAGESLVLAHRVVDDALVNVTGLSAGTRDQLVASVRLAAAERSPLPFIADDLFVNADDARTAAGFRVLADLAHGRQVIYLTHHRHLVALAREAVGAGLSVLELV